MALPNSKRVRTGPTSNRAAHSSTAHKKGNSAHGHSFETCQVGRVFVLNQPSPPVRQALEEVVGLWWDKDDVVTGIPLLPIERVAARPTGGDFALMLALKILPKFNEF